MLNPRSRLRAIVGGATAFYLQSVDVPRPMVNLMVPLTAWAGARLQLSRRLAATARAGVLGYYSTADLIVGARERSATGAGATVGMALGFGPAVVCLDRWYIDEPVTVVRIGLAP